MRVRSAEQREVAAEQIQCRDLLAVALQPDVRRARSRSAVRVARVSVYGGLPTPPADESRCRGDIRRPATGCRAGRGTTPPTSPPGCRRRSARELQSLASGPPPYEIIGQPAARVPATSRLAMRATCSPW
jgi:hypothetical protein